MSTNQDGHEIRKKTSDQEENVLHSQSSGLPTPDNSSWILLTEGKQHSRLLYANPVCFLCTSTRTIGHTDPTITDDTVMAASPSLAQIEQKETSDRTRNVMVISWLTATNNNGAFLLSVNRNRFTAASLLESTQQMENSTKPVSFVLCVPVLGMEELVKSVGSTSGRWGSKFASKMTLSTTNFATQSSEGKTPTREENNQPGLSKRQQKKLKKQRFVDGIPGLIAVPLGESTRPLDGDEENDLFAIQGTVAHLRCHINCILDGNRSSESTKLVDQDHLLISAQVVRAYCKSSYWDSAKNLFIPRSEKDKPYLSFFGSQTFGYVLPPYVVESCYNDRL